jgi:hypothetical protein
MQLVRTTPPAVMKLRLLSVALLTGLALPATVRADDDAWFEEVAAASGLDWSHVSGARGDFWFPEIMGGGVAFLDYDGDGLLDIYLVQSGHLDPGKDDAGEPLPNPLGNKLYRNTGDGFVDVTEAAGVGDTGYGMGVACADYDRDGDVDIYVTNVGQNVLYRNDGDGTFTDVSTQMKVADPRWGTSAAFVDIDGDYDLDLYVVNNLTWSPNTETPCYSYETKRDYCSPENYNAASPDVLFRLGARLGFQDVTTTSGVNIAWGNGLGLVVADYDMDGDVDIYVANDATPNVLWQNDGKGHFENVGLLAGCAVNGNGTPEAGMGVQFFDMDMDGDLDLFMTHLRRESNTFYRNRGGRFSDKTHMTGMAQAGLEYTGFGMAFHDFDLDGQLDLYVVNGAVQAWPENMAYAEDRYAEPNQLFRGLGGSKFEEVAGGGTPEPLIGTSRGAAFGDYDNDGDVDVCYVDRDARVKLLRNSADGHAGWVRFQVLDKRGRTAHAALVGVEAGGRKLYRLADPAYSYCSSNDARVHFGLGVLDGAPVTQVDSVDVRWANGKLETFAGVPGMAEHVLREGRGEAAEER